MSLNNEPCKITSSLINLNYVEFNCSLFMISLDKCSRSCNTLREISGKLCVPNKIENVKFNVSNLITRTNESKINKIYTM